MSNGKICLAKWAKDGMAGKGLVLPEIDNSGVYKSRSLVILDGEGSFTTEFQYILGKECIKAYAFYTICVIIMQYHS